MKLQDTRTRIVLVGASTVLALGALGGAAMVASAAHPEVVKAAPAPEPTETPAAAETPGSGVGHADEIPGATTESSADHEFGGQE